jgi:hypothetical protein
MTAEEGGSRDDELDRETDGVRAATDSRGVRADLQAALRARPDLRQREAGAWT